MKHVNLGGWQVSITPFPKLHSTASRHGGQRHAFIAILGNFIQNEDGTLKEGTFSITKSQAKGTILIVDRRDDSKKMLLTLRLDDGFRGSSGVHADLSPKVRGQILADAQCSSNCEGQSTYAVLLHPGDTFVCYESGRRTDRVYTHTNQNGELVSAQYTSSEWEAMKATQDVEDLKDLEIL